MTKPVDDTESTASAKQEAAPADTPAQAHDTAPAQDAQAAPAATVQASSSVLILHNRPSVWVAGTGIAVIIFLFGYVSGVAISNHSMRHMRRDWPQHMHGHSAPYDTRGSASSMPAS